MQTHVLTATQLAILDRLKTVTAVHPFYLAGGTALALRHGHRRSIDFDFFRVDPFDVEELLGAIEDVCGRVERQPTGEGTLYVRLEGVTTSFFRYRYALLEPLEATPWGFGLAADSDIAAMKIEAIAGRGSRKDFVDLRILCRAGLTLEAAFELFERKYGTRRTDRYHRLRALCYFADAEREPMPDLLVPFDWEECMRFFTREAERLLATGCG